jgi:SAM-dependent methyltransferase
MMNRQEESVRGQKVRTRRSAIVSAFDELAAQYDAWFDGEGKVIFPIEVQALQQALPSLPEPWLEVGVGSGRFAQALGIKTGIDPSVKLLEMAGKRGVTTLSSRGERTPFGEAAFGTVFLIVTLCFVDSALQVLKEAHRILRRDGRLVLGLVLRESPWGKLYQGKKKLGHPFYRHAEFYSYDELLILLKESGFSIERAVSTLFQKPGMVEYPELPQSGYNPAGGFTVLVARRRVSTGFGSGLVGDMNEV